MREKLTVIKVGGKIVEEEATLCKLLDDFAAIEGYKVPAARRRTFGNENRSPVGH